MEAMQLIIRGLCCHLAVMTPILPEIYSTLMGSWFGRSSVIYFLVLLLGEGKDCLELGRYFDLACSISSIKGHMFYKDSCYSPSQLSVIAEDEPTGGRSRLGSVPEGVTGSNPTNPTKPPSPTASKRAAPPAPISTLTRLKNLNYLDKPEEGLEPPVSPVPLPPGVVCIDNVDDGNLVNGPDIIVYLRQREVEFQKCVSKGKRVINSLLVVLSIFVSQLAS